MGGWRAGAQCDFVLDWMLSDCEAAAEGAKCGTWLADIRVVGGRAAAPDTGEA